MDLTSLPFSPWTVTQRHVTETRVALAKSADLLRIEQRYLKAEKLYREAARYADGMAAKHLLKLADHCRTAYEAEKKRKQRKAKKGGR